MKLNVAFNVSFWIVLIFYACFYFLFFICALLTTCTKPDGKKRENDECNLKWKSRGYNNTPPQKNLSTFKRHHITTRFIRRKDIYLRWAEQRACGHTEDPSSLLRPQIRRWMDGWTDDGRVDGFVNKQSSVSFLGVSGSEAENPAMMNHRGSLKPRTGLMKQTPPPVIQLQVCACVCTRGQQRPLRDTRWAGKRHRRFVLCSLLLGLSFRSLFNILSPFLSPRVCALHVSIFFSVMLLLNLVLLYMWYSSFHTWVIFLSLLVSLFMRIWCFVNDLFQWH